ncbi:MAG: glycosyltransferase family 2 protein [Oscillospiraceae bacterium]|nr:glycosyltransferase family 2 protein [Oscillospiraceae bacterium]
MRDRSMPLVSVITLTYQNFDHLFDTIRSVLAQDHPDFEYIISDDGSDSFPKEDVLQLVRENRPEGLKRFRLLLHKKNVGTVKHLNNVLRQCKGEYIFDIAGNDMLFSRTTLSDIVRAFDECKCDVLFTSRASYAGDALKEIVPHVRDWDRMTALDTPIKRYRAMMRSEHCDMFIGTNLIYKRKVIEKLHYFDERYHLFEDAPMIARLLWSERVAIRPDILYVLYDSETGVSSKKHYHPLLTADISRYNRIGKKEHYDALDRSTQDHIDFGIERAQAQNKLQLAAACLKHLPRCIHLAFYRLGRSAARYGDKRYIQTLDLSEHSFLKQRR